MMRGQALRYLGWMTFDRTMPRLLACWVIIAAICLPMHFAMRNSAPPPEVLAGMVRQLHTQFVWISVLVIFHGIIAEDRTRGFYRFYLAKPVSPLWFYGQSYVLGLAATVLYSAGFAVIFSLMVKPAWSFAYMKNGLANGLLVGGLLFVFSALMARDWFGMVVILVATAILRGRYPADASTTGKVLNAVLPPIHLMNGNPTAAQWAWIAAWGLGFVALGLLVLRRRPLGED